MTIQLSYGFPDPRYLIRQNSTGETGLPRLTSRQARLSYSKAPVLGHKEWELASVAHRLT